MIPRIARLRNQHGRPILILIAWEQTAGSENRIDNSNLDWASDTKVDGFCQLSVLVATTLGGTGW